MNKKVLELLQKTFSENNNSHAFLMQTNNIDNCLSDILNLIGNINKLDSLNKESVCNYADIKVIFPDGKEIKKNQMLEVLDEFKTYPVQLKHRYYIIMGADMMNSYAANVLLKFLEEPENSVVGFLVTTNKQGVIKTLVSRCQLYSLNYSEATIDTTFVDEFLKNMDNNVFKRVLYLKDFFGSDRSENILKLKTISKEMVSMLKYEVDIDLFNQRLNLITNSFLQLQRNANQELVILNLARKW